MGVFPTSSFQNVWDFPRRRALSVCVDWKDRGFIQGYTALLEPALSGCLTSGICEITLNRGAPDVFEQFNAAVQNLKKFKSVIWFP